MIIKTDRSEFESYLHDASNFSGSCNAVYFPESASDISDILKSAQASGTEVTVSGNGTGVTGGRVPQGGIVLSVEKLNAAPVFNEFAQSVLVSAGFLLGDFMSLCIDKQLFYPPDPTEKNCFIGATIATNATAQPVHSLTRSKLCSPTVNY
jgi:D-lactate dehydrogenase (cytochrome)